MAITREDYVTQSVQTFVRKALFEERGYPESMIEMMESFDDNMFDRSMTPQKNYIASGFDFDDDGRQAELGSDLMMRQYTLEFFTIGLSSQWGKNIAQAIKFAIEKDGLIPLLDISVPTDPPQIDSIVLDGVSANRVIVTDPAPWQEHIWITRARVTDEYNARLT